MENNVCEQFIEKCSVFKWFIVRYFGLDYFDELVDLAKRNENAALVNRLNSVWFELPDAIFNIGVNPPGWFEFLSIIEE